MKRLLLTIATVGLLGVYSEVQAQCGPRGCGVRGVRVSVFSGGFFRREARLARHEARRVRHHSRGVHQKGTPVQKGTPTQKADPVQKVEAPTQKATLPPASQKEVRRSIPREGFVQAPGI